MKQFLMSFLVAEAFSALLLVILLVNLLPTSAWIIPFGNRVKGCHQPLYSQTSSEDIDLAAIDRPLSRRSVLASAFAVTGVVSMGGHPAWGYTPDSDPLRESLYFISRVQEATVQQERFVNRSTDQAELQQKMKLTLRLVEKNYKLLDQINYCSQFIDPKDVVAASEAGYEAVDSLTEAIEFVKKDLNSKGGGPLTKEQREFLTSAMQNTRQQLFTFLKYLPQQDKLEQARKRVEDENVANREEYDGDGTEGVYNPVVLPWKQQQS